MTRNVLFRLVGPAVAWLAIALALPSSATAADEAERDALVAKAAAYFAEYQQRVGSLLCEEHYDQTMLIESQQITARTWGGGGTSPDIARKKRSFTSDYLLWLAPDGTGWEPVRDVFSTDAHDVRKRGDRVSALGALTSRGEFDPRAAAIRAEGSMHRVGNIAHAVNVPTYVLALLGDGLRTRLAFKLGGRERIDGVETRVIEFEETARPTLMRDQRDQDSPSSGRLWIDPATGAVVRTRIETGPRTVRTRVDTFFARDAALGVWIPVEMREQHTVPGEKLEGKATYRSCRPVGAAPPRAG